MMSGYENATQYFLELNDFFLFEGTLTVQLTVKAESLFKKIVS